MANLHVEKQLVQTFVEKKQCRRILATIDNPKGRRKFIKSLSHSLELNPKYSEFLPSGLHSATKILNLLRKEKAPYVCYILSENPNLDGLTMPLVTALEEIFSTGSASILSCEPERLGVYFNEDACECYLLMAQPTFM